MILTDKLLLPEDDGLPMRDSHPYVHYKLEALKFYLSVINTAMHNKWPNRWYIDLQAGPGKNRIGNNVALGSPLLALTAPHPSTRFIFNEMNSKLYDALRQRVSASQLAGQVTILNDDANSIVTQVCREIHRSSLNYCFP
jgi:three-Cys-motif partner protein